MPEQDDFILTWQRVLKSTTDMSIEQILNWNSETLQNLFSFPYPSRLLNCDLAKSSPSFSEQPNAG